MTQPTMRYEWVCIKPDITYEYFYERLKKEWDQTINSFINQPDKCNSRLGELVEIYKHATPENIAHARQFFSILTSTEETSSVLKKLDNIDIDNIVLDVVATSIMKTDGDHGFQLQRDFPTSMKSLGKILVENCQCQYIDIYKYFIKKYRKKYSKKFEGKNKNEIIEILREDYKRFKHLTQKLNMPGNKIDVSKTDISNKLANELTGLYSFTIHDELNTLIPNELGSLKEFFITVVAKYYDELHPVIWTQIFKNMTENLFVDLPFTSEEIFAFASKYLLLNSGPFILKMLQLIRPVLTDDLAKKYNLAKLKYPLLEPKEIDLILSKAVYNWDMYKILANYSASVGHVCKVVRVDDPSNIFIIKIIKPLTVAQSCWEYKTLYNVFPEGTCEQTFIKNILESNGKELNVNGEIENVTKGHKYYTDDYENVFDVDINAKLTTIENIPGIIYPGCWFALTMTLAPGVPLSNLIENKLVENDTKYRAKLHRCLDILIFKFFSNFVQNGFYHGDLHSGNIFFSYENNQMTLIDFGAVGEIDIYAGNPDIKTLLDTILMSLFYNYDEMLDTMTHLLNSKCVETQIDMNTPEYQNLKKELICYKIENIKNKEIEAQKSDIYKKNIFSEQRIADEKKMDSDGQHYWFDPQNVNSIYSYLEYKPKDTETIVENQDILPEFTEKIGNSTNISFAGVLEKIIKFYALSGVNIAIKFNELYNIQKAYALLLGVLHKVHYNSYRMNIALNRAIKNWKNITALQHVGTVTHLVKSYYDQKNKHNEFKEKYNIHEKPLTASNGQILSEDTPSSKCSLLEKTAQPNTKKEIIYPVDTNDMNHMNIDPDMIGGNGNDNIYMKKYFKYKTKYYKMMLQ